MWAYDFLERRNTKHEFTSMIIVKPAINLIGKRGRIKSIDGNRFISVDKSLYKYKTVFKKDDALGGYYIIQDVMSDNLLIL